MKRNQGTNKRMIRGRPAFRQRGGNRPKSLRDRSHPFRAMMLWQLLLHAILSSSFFHPTLMLLSSSSSRRPSCGNKSFVAHAHALVVRRSAIMRPPSVAAGLTGSRRSSADDDDGNGISDETDPGPTAAASERQRRDGGGSSSGGYRVGDLTRGVMRRFQGRVASLTGKDSYRLGDLTLWLDGQAREQVGRFTATNQTATNNADADGGSSYRFGDVSRELVRRLQEGDYTQDDLVLFLKIAVTVGINLTPVARVLPVRVLLDLLNLTLEASIAQSVTERVVSTITNEVDARMKHMMTGDRNYQVGDLTRRAVARWAGKDQYEFGDLTRTVMRRAAASWGGVDANNGQESTREDATDFVPDDGNRLGTTSGAATLLHLNEQETEQLEAWDRNFLAFQRENGGLAGHADDEKYEDWDERFLSSSSSPSSLPLLFPPEPDGPSSATSI